MSLGVANLSVFVFASLSLVIGGPAAQTDRLCECRRLGLRGVEQMRLMQYQAAASSFERAIAAAARERDDLRIAKFHNNLGAAQMAQFQYSKALASFVAARDAAHALGNREVEGGSWLNLASLYTAMGAGAAADYALGEALRLMPPASPYIPKLKSQQVRLALRLGDTQRALGEWADALQAAQDGGDRQSERDLWDALAMIEMLRGNLDAAERAIANEFRVVVLNKLNNRDFLFSRVGRLRLAQGRASDAVEWYNRARAEQRAAASPAIPWVLAQERAAALVAAGRRSEGLEAYREAWQLAFEWRQDVLPAQSADLAADVSLASLSEEFASLLMAAPATRDGAASAREAWAAVEQGRAAGLRRRSLRRSSTLRGLNADYIQLLSKLRQAVVAGSAEERDAIEARLTEMEARAGAGNADETAAAAAEPETMMRRVQAALAPDEALITFLVTEPRSWVWSLTRERLDWAALPGRSELRRVIQAFRQSILDDRSEAAGLGHSLFRVLFGGLPAGALARSRWSLSQDDVLFECPLAALRDAQAPGGPYLAETKVLRSVPSALWLLHGASRPNSRKLLAVGDAIHNGADPRLRLERPSYAPLSFRVIPWPTGTRAQLDTLELPSLPGSREEVRAVSGLWREAGLPASVLTGAAASERAVESAFQNEPAVIHFATHVVPAPAGRDSFLVRLRAGEHARAGAISATAPGDPLLTLSINSSGYREGIDAEILAGCSTPGALVVLNGCSTARGRVLPGAGLSGFTDAWLAAGARSVIASLWPVGDDGEAFFTVFYRAVLNGRAPADSLRDAQTAMIRSAGWRSQPRYWSAYLSVGKE
jgi:CHAT domain-containing protein